MGEKSQARLTAFQNFIIAGSAASVARASVNGFSVLKIRSEVGVPGYKMGLMKSVATTWRSERFGGFLKGLNAAVIKSFFHVGIQFTVFDKLTKPFTPDFLTYEPGQQVPVWPIVKYLCAIFFSGGTAGLVATLCTHPLDLVKTRLVVQGMGDPRNYKDIQDCFAKIVKADGVVGLYRGLKPSLAGSFLVSSNLLGYWNLLQIFTRDGVIEPSELAILVWIPVVTITPWVSYHEDVLRRKMMASDGSLPKNGPVDIRADRLLQTLIRKLTECFRGYWYRYAVVKLTPQVACFWLTYQFLEKEILSKKKGFFIE